MVGLAVRIGIERTVGIDKANIAVIIAHIAFQQEIRPFLVRAVHHDGQFGSLPGHSVGIAHEKVYGVRSSRIGRKRIMLLDALEHRIETPLIAGCLHVGAQSRQGYRFPEGKRQIARRRRTVRKDDGRFRFRKDNVLLAARGQHQEKRKEDKQSFHFYCLWINSDCFCSSRQKQRTSKHEKTGPVLSSCGVGFSDQ